MILPLLFLLFTSVSCLNKFHILTNSENPAGCNAEQCLFFETACKLTAHQMKETATPVLTYPWIAEDFVGNLNGKEPAVKARLTGVAEQLLMRSWTTQDIDNNGDFVNVLCQNDPQHPSEAISFVPLKHFLIRGGPGGISANVLYLGNRFFKESPSNLHNPENLILGRLQADIVTYQNAIKQHPGEEPFASGSYPFPENPVSALFRVTQMIPSIVGWGQTLKADSASFTGPYNANAWMALGLAHAANPQRFVRDPPTIKFGGDTKFTPGRSQEEYRKSRTWYGGRKSKMTKPPHPKRTTTRPHRSRSRGD